MILSKQKTTVSPKWEGLNLRCSCAVWVMLATLVMTARSCFNQWRQADARHRLKPFHLLPNDVNIDREKRGTTERHGGSFTLKALHGTLRGSLVVSLWGSGGFFRVRRGCQIKLFLCYVWWLVKETRLWPSRLTVLRRLSDAGLFDTVSGSLPTSTFFSLFLWMRCKYDDVTDATFSWSYGGAQLS